MVRRRFWLILTRIFNFFLYACLASFLVTILLFVLTAVRVLTPEHLASMFSYAVVVDIILVVIVGVMFLGMWVVPGKVTSD